MKVAKMFVFLVVGALVLGVIVFLLWNALVPDLFHGPSITLMQSIGLLVLSHILLRGWGRWRYSNGWRHERWRRKFEEKLAAMTPEEREKFKAEWEHRCGYRPGERTEKTAHSA